MVFSGRAVYDSGVWDGVAEDVSDMITMISPSETPLLDRLGDAPFAARSVYHEWLEDSLNPNTLTSSTAITSTTAATTLLVHDGAGSAVARYLQVGMQLKINGTGEYLQISAIDATNNYIVVSRQFGSTTAVSYGAGATISILGPVALEGADVGEETGRPRVRKGNYCQIFSKDVIVSGTVQAITHIGVDNELERQTVMRMRELLRDLEKTAIQGKTSGNSLGSSTAYRSTKGIWDFITTNVTTTGATSVTADWLNGIIQDVWEQGATDTDLIVCDANWKKIIDGFNDSRIEVTQSDGTREYRRRVTMFESTFGEHEVVLGRWMPTNSLMVLSRDRVKVVPLQGRSFQMLDIARTGDAVRRKLVGEYAVEVRNEAGLAKAMTPNS